MYNKVSTNMDFAKRELDTLDFWQKNQIFEKSAKSREGCPVFTFYDGPPTANGMPHIGHILTRVVKDIIPRYRTMKGYKVIRKAGWDTHGLPVELEVEKELGISGKPEIENYGVEPFIQKCKQSVWKYENEWRQMSERVGFWLDMDNPYITYENHYIESVWWSLKQIWEKDLLYKGHKVVPYCPRCGTSLSSHEVAQGYKDVKEKSAIAKFKLLDGDAAILAWTTTPWTLPSNTALAVNENIDYVKVSYEGEQYILAEALVASVLGEEATVLEKMKGAALKGLRYQPLFNYFPEELADKAHFVVADNYVSITDGTGVVHIAPAFGEDDYRLGRENNLPFVQLVDEQGNFVPLATDFAGLFVKEADPKIIAYLKEKGLLLKAEDYEHSYPFCWRCDTPLLYYARDTWFIKMTAVRDQLVANNNTVNWIPDNIKQGRFGNFLENVIDWGLSRERYWGTPLPIWECAEGHRHVIGSIQELYEMGIDVPENIELHKPFIDNVKLTCPQCQKEMTRVTEVIDCWYDSGSMPFAQFHYPFENKAVFEENFPADFISEAVDQTRGWFYTLMAISTLIFEKSPYKNVIVLGHVQDKDGQKMSKHKGNVVDPWSVLNKQGADAVRWYFYTNSSPWLPSRFYEDAVGEAQRKFMGTFWNTYAFYVLYANIDNFDPGKYTLDYDALPLMDKWILSKLYHVTNFVDTCLAEYKITEPSRAMQQFIDDLSNWYVRRCRERFWAAGMPQDKINAYMTLYTVLKEFTKVSSLFVPFMAEEIYQNIIRPVEKDAEESIHLCKYPVIAENYKDLTLEENMDLAMNIVVQGRAARNTAAIKNRQPIGEMLVKADKTLPELFLNIVAEELNVKKVAFTDDVSSFTTYTFKPQLRTLGPKYGKLLGKISKALQEVDGSAFMDALQKGPVELSLDGDTATLTLEDVLYETAQKEGYMAQSDKGVTVVLNTNLTEELIEEGFVREIISKLQTMRKEAGFEVLDRIRVYHKDSRRIAEIIERNKKEIMEDVLCDLLEEGEKGYSKLWNLNGESVTLSVEKQ